MKRMIATSAAPAANARRSPCRRNSPASSWRPSPLDLDANTATGVRRPTPTMKKTLNTLTPKEDAASGTVPVRPIMTLSVMPISTWLSCPIVIGIARSSVARASLRMDCIGECYCGAPGDVQGYIC